ncbi:MAG: phytanoyl-CoA dioxygenase family protein [Acidobacteriota bacterium]
MVEDSPKNALQRHGFVIVGAVVDATTVETLRCEADRMAEQSSTRGGSRNLLQRSELLARTAGTEPLLGLARELLGPRARPTKLTLFDKKPGANWKIRWHQDVTITVRQQREVTGFGAWSVKEGVPHVRPPASVLEGLVALRLHLDDTPKTNGALRVIPGSHLEGRLSRDAIGRLRQANPEVTCAVPAGGVMAMKPLLLHASSAADSPSNRRVLHFEYAAEPLPGGLAWA